MQRGLLGENSSGDFYPLWFHFENERNIHLWKEGLSLEDIEFCRVWLDPLQLIEKILSKSHKEPSPFSSPEYFSLEGTGEIDQSEASRYYQALATLLEKAIPHLHALSFVGAQVLESTKPLQEMILKLKV